MFKKYLLEKGKIKIHLDAVTTTKKDIEKNITMGKLEFVTIRNILCSGRVN